MLVQDTLTGYLHEVPDSELQEADLEEYPGSMGESQMVYDGLGNPVGFLKWVKKAVKKVGGVAKRLAPVASLLPIPGAGFLPQAIQAARRYLPGAVRAAQQYAPLARRVRRYLPSPIQQHIQRYAPIAQRAAQSWAPGLSEDIDGYAYYGEVAPGVAPRPMGPPPPGWMPRPSPYQGRKGRRVYLRCAMWPGPKGLVPKYAAQSPAVATTPVVPGVAPVIVPTASRMGPRRRVYRRRRR